MKYFTKTASKYTEVDTKIFKDPEGDLRSTVLIEKGLFKNPKRANKYHTSTSASVFSMPDDIYKKYKAMGDKAELHDARQKIIDTTQAQHKNYKGIFQIRTYGKQRVPEHKIFVAIPESQANEFNIKKEIDRHAQDYYGAPGKQYMKFLRSRPQKLSIMHEDYDLDKKISNTKEFKEDFARDLVNAKSWTTYKDKDGKVKKIYNTTSPVEAHEYKKRFPQEYVNLQTPLMDRWGNIKII